MLQKIFSSLIIVAVAFSLIMCGEADNPQAEMNQFVSVFDNNQFNAGFNPIDMVQTDDGSYIVLAEEKVTDTTEIPNIYLLKADKYGNFVKELEIGDSLINPVGHLTVVENKLYFFCMVSVVKANGKDARLASFDSNLDGFKTTNLNGITYPAAASYAGNQFVLLSYNIDDKLSVISTISAAGAVTKSKGYTVGEGDDSEEPILNHFLRTDKIFPFDVGLVAGGVYYFNGFYNYTFSLVFTNISDDEPMGIVAGYNDKGGFSAITPLSASKYAAARFNFGNNYLLPNTTITATSNATSTDANFKGYSLPELIPDTKVKILRATAKEKNILIYGADTQTRQIGLYFYNEADGTFMSSRYLGFSNPYQIGCMIATEDGGLAVCGTTYLAGRFPRICIFKLSKEEVASNVK